MTIIKQCSSVLCLVCLSISDTLVVSPSIAHACNTLYICCHLTGGCYAGRTGRLDPIYHTGNNTILKHIYAHSTTRPLDHISSLLNKHTLCREVCAVKYVWALCLFSIFAQSRVRELAFFLQTWFSPVGCERLKIQKYAFSCYSCTSIRLCLSLCVSGRFCL